MMKYFATCCLLILVIWGWVQGTSADTEMVLTATPSPVALLPLSTPTIPPTPTHTPPATWTPTPTTTPAIPLTPSPTPDISITQALLDGKFDITFVGACHRLNSFDVSPDGLWVHIRGDAIYRLSDGVRWLDNAKGFIYYSPDRQYIFVEHDQPKGVLYRLMDRQALFEGRHSGVSFSPDSQYVVIRIEYEYSSIYRLSDGLKILDAHGASTFTSDSQYVYVQGNNALYRLSDGVILANTRRGESPISRDGRYIIQDGVVYRLPEFEPVLEAARNAVFSASSQYVSTSDGIYRLSDGERIFSHFSNVYLLRNEEYVLALGDIYRLSDGERVLDDVDVDISTRFSPDNQYISTSQGVYRLSDATLLLNTRGWFTADSQFAFTRDREYGGVYRLSDGVRLVDTGDQRITFTPTEQFFYIGQPHRDTLKLYRLPDGEMIIEGEALTFSPDDEYVYVTDISGVNRIYRLSDRALILTTPNSLITFAPNNEYVILDDGIYSLPDAQKISNLVMNLQFIPDNDQQALTPCGIAQVNLDADPVILTTNTRANLREKPEYTVLRQVESGLDLIAIGRSADGLWYRVVNPLHPDDRRREFWISASVVSVRGDVDHLLIVE